MRNYGTGWNPQENTAQDSSNGEQGTNYEPNEYYDNRSFTSSFQKRIVRKKRARSKGQQRPTPFWIRFLDKQCPLYNVVIPDVVSKRRICGAYSRKYTRVRKFRKERLF